MQIEGSDPSAIWSRGTATVAIIYPFSPNTEYADQRRSAYAHAGQRELARRSAYHGFPVSRSPRRSAYFKPIGLRTAKHVNFYLAFISSRVGLSSRAEPA